MVRYLLLFIWSALLVLQTGHIIVKKFSITNNFFPYLTLLTIMMGLTSIIVSHFAERNKK
jgi:cytochrome c oxidase subunit IV